MLFSHGLPKIALLGSLLVVHRIAILERRLVQQFVFFFPLTQLLPVITVITDLLHHFVTRIISSDKLISDHN